MRFKEKICLVTGGGSGIGRATCVRFAAEGGRVMVVDLKEEGAQGTVSLITSAGGEANYAVADVARQDLVVAAIQKTVDLWGRIDVIVNNAAMMTFKPLVDLTEEEWDQVLAVNLRSVFLFCKYGLPHMPDGGAIVNVSSVHAHQTTPNVSPYAASKGAMEALTRGLSREVDHRKIRVNCVAPGAVNTPMLWSNPNIKSGAEKIEGSVGEPEDIAAAIAYIASDEARFTSGTTLIVDGGRLDIL
jgi:NAD(P)-dependent dehydrogenase (short-subunit alcohol dehydrogenase family)